MSDAFPQHVLCVLGTGLDLAEVERVAAGFGGFVLDHEYSASEPDDRMPEAFAASGAAVSFEDADRAAVESHDTVAYLLSAPMMRELAADTSRRLLAATAALLRSGATAVKHEGSRLTHGRERWLGIADDASEATGEALALALVEAWVKRPVRDGEVSRTCGMHLLGAPEVEIEIHEDMSARERRVHLDALALYLLTDPRGEEIEDGEGFRLTEDAPRWILRTGDCHFEDPDDLSFNPYGYVRLTRP
ncbi:hypothetical protein [Actinomadura oligospora]|uniref:hypothetical protein n=1 Tax=Actinomadura oligospora TaxID=111804 RepID=UPI00047AC984|nr:hypothetical protein [Actinomadura oligospora]